MDHRYDRQTLADRVQLLTRMINLLVVMGYEPSHPLVRKLRHLRTVFLMRMIGDEVSQLLVSYGVPLNVQVLLRQRLQDRMRDRTQQLKSERTPDGRSPFHNTAGPNRWRQFNGSRWRTED